MKRARIHFSFISALLVGAAILAPIQAQAKTSDLKTVTVKTIKLDNLRRFEGSVEAVNKSTVSAQTSGRIKSINFDVDDYVKAGETIVTFYDAEHKSRLIQAQSNLNAATAQRISTEQTFKRTQKLYKRGTVSLASFDNAKSAYESAKAREESAKAALKQAQEQLGYTIVKAPYSGFVVERHVQLGEIANPGKPLMTGFSLEKLRVKAEIPQQYAIAIRKANTAIIYGPNGQNIKATSLTVFPFADPKSNTVTVRIALPQGVKSVFPGMLVKTAFKVGESTSLSIPQEALVRRGELTGAYIINANGDLRLQQVVAGRLDGNGLVEILSGLKEGDTIALNPLNAAIELKSKVAEEK